MKPTVVASAYGRASATSSRQRPRSIAGKRRMRPRTAHAATTPSTTPTGRGIASSGTSPAPAIASAATSAAVSTLRSTSMAATVPNCSSTASGICNVLAKISRIRPTPASAVPATIADE